MMSYLLFSILNFKQLRQESTIVPYTIQEYLKENTWLTGWLSWRSRHSKHVRQRLRLKYRSCARLHPGSARRGRGSEGGKPATAKARRRGRSAAARKAQSQKMKEYWARRRAELPPGRRLGVQEKKVINAPPTAWGAIQQHDGQPGIDLPPIKTRLSQVHQEELSLAREKRSANRSARDLPRASG